MWHPEVGGQQSEHVRMTKYHTYTYVCASCWSYKMHYISLHSMHNIKILSRYIIFQTCQQLMNNVFLGHQHCQIWRLSLSLSPFPPCHFSHFPDRFLWLCGIKKSCFNQNENVLRGIPGYNWCHTLSPILCRISFCWDTCLAHWQQCNVLSL